MFGATWSCSMRTSIAANQKGLIIVNGLLDGLSILPTSTFADGDAIYLGATAGTITNVKPTAPNHLVYLGFCTTASAGAAGRMYVRVQNGYELQELHNVKITSVANNDILKYNSSNQLWENSNVLSTKQDTITGAASTITTSNLTASRALVSDGSGKVATNAVTSTELGYLSGVTSNIQTQLNAKGVGILSVVYGGSVIAAGQTTFAAFGNIAGSATENPRRLVMPVACTMSNFFTITSTAQPASGAYTMTIRKNNADTALIITIAAGSAAGNYSNTTNSATFVAGDTMTIKFTNNATSGAASVISLSCLMTRVKDLEQVFKTYENADTEANK